VAEQKWVVRKSRVLRWRQGRELRYPCPHSRLPVASTDRHRCREATVR
jgi:hypothetical protein